MPTAQNIIVASFREVFKFFFKYINKKPLTDIEKKQVEKLKDVFYNTLIYYKQPFDDHEFSTSIKDTDKDKFFINQEWTQKTVYINSISLNEIRSIMQNVDFPKNKFKDEEFELFYDNEIGMHTSQYEKDFNDGFINTECVFVSINCINSNIGNNYKFVPYIPTFRHLIIILIKLKERLKSGD